MTLHCPHCGGPLALVAPQAAQDATGQEIPAGMGLGEGVAAFVAEKRSSKAWTEAWAPVAEAYLQRFVEWCPAGARVAEVGRPEVAGWKASLQGADSHLGRPLAPKTVNSHLTVLGSFFSWAKAAGYRQGDNPVEGQKLRRAKRPQDERAAFTDEEVGLILHRLGSTTFTDFSRLLLPWIMAYTGARNEEVAQLRWRDLVEVEGILCFDFATLDAGQRRKTTASRRLIPVHSRLRSLLDPQVDARPNPDRNLLGLEEERRRLAELPSRWFNGVFLPEVLPKAASEGKTLYSLRHTVATQLKVKHQLPEHRIAEVLGHANSSLTTGRYGKRFDVGGLRETVELLEYPAPTFHPLSERR